VRERKTLIEKFDDLFEKAVENLSRESLVKWFAEVIGAIECNITKKDLEIVEMSFMQILKEEGKE